MADTETAPVVNGNGQKVTNAEIKKDIERLFDEVREMRDEARRWRESAEQRIRDTERKQTTLEVQMDNLDADVKQWNILNSAGVVLAGILAAVGITQK